MPPADQEPVQVEELAPSLPLGRPIDPIIVTGNCDKIAQTEHELMFLNGEQIELVQELGEGRFLGKCSGVVGVVYADDLTFPVRARGSVKDKDSRERRSRRYSKTVSIVVDGSEEDRHKKKKSDSLKRKSKIEEEGGDKEKKEKKKEKERDREKDGDRDREKEEHRLTRSKSGRSRPKDEDGLKRRKSKRRSEAGEEKKGEGKGEGEEPVEKEAMAPPQESVTENSQEAAGISRTQSNASTVSQSPSNRSSVVISRYPLNSENTDEFGFDRASSMKDSHSISTTWDVSTYRRREVKWAEMTKSVEHWRKLLKSSFPLIKERCYKGIPPSIRGRAWRFLSNATFFKERYENKDFMFFYKEERSDIVEVIERDIDRCFPNHIMFREVDGSGQVELSHILKAYAFFNPDIGYCQGMGMVAGLLLMEMPSDDAFWILVTLLGQEKYLFNFYDGQLSQLKFSVSVFWALVGRNYPTVQAHLTKQGVDPLMFVTQWYMCVFTTTLPWASVLRVWDVFLLIGRSFLHKVSLAIIEIHQKTILACKDIQQLLEFLLHIPPETLIPELLFKAIDQLKIKTRDIEEISLDLALKKTGR